MRDPPTLLDRRIQDELFKFLVDAKHMPGQPLVKEGGDNLAKLLVKLLAGLKQLGNFVAKALMPPLSG